MVQPRHQGGRALSSGVVGQVFRSEDNPGLQETAAVKTRLGRGTPALFLGSGGFLVLDAEFGLLFALARDVAGAVRGRGIERNGDLRHAGEVDIERALDPNRMAHSQHPCCIAAANAAPYGELRARVSIRIIHCGSRRSRGL